MRLRTIHRSDDVTRWIIDESFVTLILFGNNHGCHGFIFLSVTSVVHLDHACCSLLRTKYLLISATTAGSRISGMMTSHC